MSLSYTKKVTLNPEQVDFIKEAVEVGFTAWAGYRCLIADRMDEILGECQDKVIDPIFLKMSTKRLLKPNAPPVTNEEKKRLGEAKLALTAVYVQVLAVQPDLIPLQWTSTAPLLQDYPQFKDCEESELQLLLNFRNILRISLYLVPAARNKKTIMIVAGRLQGVPKEYITGSGQKLEVTHRVQIYEQTTGVRPLPRPERKPKVDPIAPIADAAAIAKNDAAAVAAVQAMQVPIAGAPGGDVPFHTQVQAAFQPGVVAVPAGGAMQAKGMRMIKSENGFSEYTVVSPLYGAVYDASAGAVQPAGAASCSGFPKASKKSRGGSKKKQGPAEPCVRPSAATQTAAGGVVQPHKTITVSHRAPAGMGPQPNFSDSVASALDDGVLPYKSNSGVQQNRCRSKSLGADITDGGTPYTTSIAATIDSSSNSSDLCATVSLYPSASDVLNDVNIMYEPLHDFVPGEAGDPLALEFSALAAENFGNDLWTNSLEAVAAPHQPTATSTAIPAAANAAGATKSKGRKTSPRGGSNAQSKRNESCKVKGRSNESSKMKLKSDRKPSDADVSDFSSVGFIAGDCSDEMELEKRDAFDNNPANTPWHERRMGFSMSSLLCCFSAGAYDDEVDLDTHISGDTTRAFYRAFPSTSTLNDDCSGDDDGSLQPPLRMSAPRAFAKDEEPPIKKRKSIDGLALLDNSAEE